MYSLSYYNSLLEEGLRLIRVAPEQARLTQANHWMIKRGSARVRIRLVAGPEQKRLFWAMEAPMLQLPPNLAGMLMPELLYLNHQLYGASFSVVEDIVYLTQTGEMAEASPTSLAKRMDAISYLADKLDDELLARVKNLQPEHIDRPAIGFQRPEAPVRAPQDEPGKASEITAENFQ